MADVLLLNCWELPFIGPIHVVINYNGMSFIFLYINHENHFITNNACYTFGTNLILFKTFLKGKGYSSTGDLAL